MADIKIRFPYPRYDDPTATVLMTMADNGDGTYSPKISASGLSASSVGGAPDTVDYLVGTASAGLSAEIVVGTTPGGELGGTWGSPTVDATHSGSSHASIQTAAESTAAVALAAHTAAADPHAGYLLESLLDAKGDLIAASAADTPARLAVGTNGQVLTAQSSTATGLAWADAAAGSGDVATDAIWDAKGDLAAGTGANTAARLAVGANDTILMADSGQATGLKWVASQTPSTQAFADAASEGTADTFARGDHKHAMPTAFGAWQTYTPSWTSDGTAPAIGNGTLSGRYRLLDASSMQISVDFIRGSTSTNGTGGYSFSLPSGYKAKNTGGLPQVVPAVLEDAGVGFLAGSAWAYPNATTFLVALGQNPSASTSQQFIAGYPVTLATNDRLSFGGIIEYETV